MKGLCVLWSRWEYFRTCPSLAEHLCFSNKLIYTIEQCPLLRLGVKNLREEKWRDI